MLKISCKGLRAAFVLIAALMVSASAHAATIDVGADTWKLANGEHSLPVGDVTSTIEGATSSWTAGLDLGVYDVSGPTVVLDDELAYQSGLISFTDPSGLIEQAGNLNGQGIGNCNNQGNGNHTGNADGHCDATGNDGQPVPEPMSLVLLGLTLVGGAWRLRRQ